MARDDLAAVIVCPSNPFLGVDPILAVDGLRDWLARCTVPRVVVSPLVGGKAVKGPLSKLLAGFGAGEDNIAIANHYGSLFSHYIVDDADTADIEPLRAMGHHVSAASTLMRGSEDRERLARRVLAIAGMNV